MKTATFAALLLVFAMSASSPALALRFTQTNLVSDLSGQALRTDANLVNPWGLAPSGSGVFWTSNNGTGTSTLYDPDGTPRPLVVTIPGGVPTGVVATAPGDSAFDVPNGSSTARAVFIFVTQSGSISAWSPAVNQTNAIEVEKDSAAIYTGAALGGTAVNPMLYVANFKGAEVEAYDTSFAEAKLAGSFSDPNLPAGYGPFNIANIGGQLYVTFVPQIDGEEQPGPGAGIVDVFDFNGNLVRRFATGAELNAPWGMAKAPSGFGSFGGDILVGNFGDGRILIFDNNGVYQGALEDTTGAQIVNHGLWGLSFGKPAGSPASQRLYFAAGIADETHGLFGYIAQAESVIVVPPVTCENHPKDTEFWQKQCKGSHDGGDGDDQGEDDFTAGHGGGADPDSLDALFAGITNAPPPNAFGSEGCFTAGCDLLRKNGNGNNSETAARELLVTRLNLAAGSLCDSLPVSCHKGPDGMTVGEVADSLDVLLCGNGNKQEIRRLADALRCANGGEGEDENDQGEDDGGSHRNVACHTDANPVRVGEQVRFSLTATKPATVQMRIYDVRGRLVAEPMKSSLVSGSASATWNGADLRGKLVAPGTYFYRTVSTGETAVGRFLIVR